MILRQKLFFPVLYMYIDEQRGVAKLHLYRKVHRLLDCGPNLAILQYVNRRSVTLTLPQCHTFLSLFSHSVIIYTNIIVVLLNLMNHTAEFLLIFTDRKLILFSFFIKCQFPPVFFSLTTQHTFSYLSCLDVRTFR